MGAQASAPAPSATSTSQALAARVLRSKGPDGSTQFASTTALEQARELSALPPLGDWWTTPAAVEVVARLDAALNALPVHFRSHALDLLAFQMLPGVDGSAQVRTRVAFSDDGGALVSADAYDATWYAPNEWIEEDESCEPAAVVLQHWYPKLARNKKDTSGFEITLRTLVCGALVHCGHDEYKRVAFGRTPIAIDAPGEQPSFNASPCTAIAVDGEWLTPVALSLLPAERRERIKAAQVAQMLHAMRDCLRYRWPGGFTMLRKRVAPLLDVDAQIAVVALATELILACTGGEPTVQSRYIRAHHADLLRKQGRAEEAAEVERIAAEEATKLPAPHMTDDQPPPRPPRMRNCLRC